MRIINRHTARLNRIGTSPFLALSLLIAGVAGCSTLGDRGKQLVPTNHQFRTGPFLFSSDFELKKDSPVVLSLESLEREVAKTLDLDAIPSDPTIEIYILNDRDSFSHFLRFYYPELPTRRAFFLAQGESRVVYTFMGPKLEEDLRHEATHALLNLRFGDLPLWLDEGLAEYFEVVSPADAGSQEHLDKLPADLAGGWKPELGRLEALADIRQMTPGDYRESWAWVYALLNQNLAGKSTLLAYLRETPTSRSETKLAARLARNGSGLNGESLVAYMNSLRNRHMTQSQATPKARTVRFQDRGPDAAQAIEPPSPQKGIFKGFFRRVGSLFGL